MILSALSIVALMAVQADQPDSGNLSAPATCVAALMYPGVGRSEPDETARHVAAWQRVMSAVNPDVTTHQPAIDRSRLSFDAAEGRRGGMGLLAAEAFANAGNCRSADLQARYVARFASAEAAAQYQSESGHD